ncbi:MAG TPA: isocitrate lyase/phosphoenolpyruvate mutase family protein [Caulobacteraceae bacterium]|nr:isocitrate lyase/phosphoenolpyruvate mutase family protein [Caulobacteraceae bacterium]
MPTPAEKRQAFHRLHESGCFIIPNPWDVGSALHLQSLGFKAIASTSSGFARWIGRPDYGIERDQLLAHLTEVAAATDIPLNADFEGGFAVEPEGVAANVRLAAATGLAGLSIEDRVIGGEQPGLLPVDLAVERVKAARAAIDQDQSRMLLVGRCEGYLVGEADLATVISRLEAYAEAGSDCLFPAGVRTAEDVAAIVKALAPRPVNVILRPDLPAKQLADIGVRRISVGGGLAYTAWRAFDEAAKTLAETEL